jgi:hypothetical protein
MMRKVRKINFGRVKHYSKIIKRKELLSVTRAFVFKRLFDPDKFPYLEELLSLVLGFKVKIEKRFNITCW